jgi:hypothetical protein
MLSSNHSGDARDLERIEEAGRSTPVLRREQIKLQVALTIPVFSRKQGDFPRKTGRRLSTNGQSLRGIRDLDHFSKSK